MLFLVSRGDGQGKWHVLIFLQKWQSEEMTRAFFFKMADRDLKLVFFFPRWQTEIMLRIFFLFKMTHRDNDMSFFFKWGTETLKFVFFFKMADGDNDTCLFSRLVGWDLKNCFLLSRYRTETVILVFFQIGWHRMWNPLVFYQDGGRRQRHTFSQNGEQIP